MREPLATVSAVSSGCSVRCASTRGVPGIARGHARSAAANRSWRSPRSRVSIASSGTAARSPAVSGRRRPISLPQSAREHEELVPAELVVAESFGPSGGDGGGLAETGGLDHRRGQPVPEVHGVERAEPELRQGHPHRLVLEADLGDDARRVAERQPGPALQPRLGRGRGARGGAAPHRRDLVRGEHARDADGHRAPAAGGAPGSRSRAGRSRRSPWRPGSVRRRRRPRAQRVDGLRDQHVADRVEVGDRVHHRAEQRRVGVDDRFELRTHGASRSLSSRCRRCTPVPPAARRPSGWRGRPRRSRSGRPRARRRCGGPGGGRAGAARSARRAAAPAPGPTARPRSANGRRGSAPRTGRRPAASRRPRSRTPPSRCAGSRRWSRGRGWGRGCGPGWRRLRVA